jgi:hypothetical protein
VSRYDLFRKRLAPIAFVLALGLLVRDSCQKDQRTHTTFELAFAAPQAKIHAVDVGVIIDNDTFATFHRAALPGGTIGPCRFLAALPSTDGELRIDVDLGDHHQQLTRQFHTIEGSTTIIHIPDDDAPTTGAPAGRP